MSQSNDSQCTKVRKYILKVYKFLSGYYTNRALWIRLLDSFIASDSTSHGMYCLDCQEKRKSSTSNYKAEGRYILVKLDSWFSMYEDNYSFFIVKLKAYTYFATLWKGYSRLDSMWTVKQIHFPINGITSWGFGWCLWNRGWNAYKPTSSTSWNSTWGKFSNHLYVYLCLSGFNQNCLKIHFSYVRKN